MELLEKILSKDNLNNAYKQVYKNKGASGVDGVTVDELSSYIKEHKEEILSLIRKRKYKPQPVRRVYILKENGKLRKLGIPSVIDRVLQQAIVQVLTPIYEEQFSNNSFGFRPGRSCEQAVIKALECFNDGYEWTEEYLEINKVDEEIYKLLNGSYLFDGVTNWDYLFNQMGSYQDYLRYYYYYTTVETRVKTDSKGNTTTELETVVHEGWHSNKYDSNNTGKVRFYHHQFYGFRIIFKDGRFMLDRSPLVDDIREIIEDYPYFKEQPVSEVYETFHKSRYELFDLTPEDFNTFGHPDLSNPNLDKGVSRVLK